MVLKKGELTSPVGNFIGSTTFRENFKQGKMRFIRCNNIGQIEGWPAGKPRSGVAKFKTTPYL